MCDWRTLPGAARGVGDARERAHHVVSGRHLHAPSAGTAAAHRREVATEAAVVVKMTGETKEVGEAEAEVATAMKADV